MPSMSWLADEASNQVKKKTLQFVGIAKELGVTPAALAIAWCSKNPHVSSVITGASRVEQIHDNMKALDAMKKIDAGVMAKLDEVFPIIS